MANRMMELKHIINHEKRLYLSHGFDLPNLTQPKVFKLVNMWGLGLQTLHKIPTQEILAPADSNWRAANIESAALAHGPEATDRELKSAHGTAVDLDADDLDDGASMDE
jgi:hypothetical protein